MAQETIGDDDQGELDQGELDDQAALLEYHLVMAEETGKPVRMSKGGFSLYATPQGGMVIAYRLDGETEDQHFPVPPMLVRVWLGRMRGESPGLGGIGAMVAMIRSGGG